MFKVNTRIKRKPEYPHLGINRGKGTITKVFPGKYQKYLIAWDNGESFYLNGMDLEHFYMPDLTAPNRIWEKINK